MDHIRSSVVELLEREQNTQQALTLTAIRTQRAVEIFQDRMAQLERERASAICELEAARDQLRQHQLLAEVCGLPSELEVYASTIRGPDTLAAQCALLETPSAPLSLFNGIAVPADRVNGKRTRSNQEAFDRCLREGAVLLCDAYDVESASMSPTSIQGGRLTVVHDLPPVATGGCYLPVLNNGAVQRRPVGADLAVCISSQFDLGRVLVNKRPILGGDTLFVEAPFFTAIDDGSRAILSDTGSALWKKVSDKINVFEAQGWDRRLASAFCQYVDTLFQGGAAAVALRDAATFLGCPLESMDTDALNSLCDFSKFLHAALPGTMHDQLSEDDITTFLVAFKTNAVAHGGMMLGDAQLSSEVKRSLFGLLSMMEHSCDPNCVVVVRKLPDVSLDVGGSAMYVAEVRAIRPIGIGERLSISYVSLLPSTLERRHTLQSRYYFVCMCTRCTSQADVTRTMFTSSNDTLVPIGEGSRWWVAGGLESCSHPEVQEGLLADRRLTEEASIDRSALNDVDRCAHYAGVLDRWLTSFEEGYLRLAPFHCTIVAVSMRLAGDILQSEASTALILVEDHIDVLLRVLGQLVSATLHIPVDCAFATSLCGRNTSLVSPGPPITAPPGSHTILTSAVAPLSEACASLVRLRGAAYERRASWMWYALAKVLECSNMEGSDRWLRAQLYTSPLAGA